MKTAASTDILIIGAGLTGLHLANLLTEEGQKVILLEARDRPGGRIHTLRNDKGAGLEMGATWFGTKHTALVKLLSGLGIDSYEQHTGETAFYQPDLHTPPQLVRLPPNDEPSCRIEGGSDRLIKALQHDHQIDISYGEVVEAIEERDDRLAVSTNKRVLLAHRVVSTLPPNLLVNSISFSPNLPSDFIQLAGRTHTWMGESIKVGLRYAEPFWRSSDQSPGTFFSNAGPITELYDHTAFPETGYALKGFMTPAAHTLTKDERRGAMLDQLRPLYGPQVDSYLEYAETVWRNEHYTFLKYEGYVAPHQYNGHPMFRQTFLNGKFFVAGSETAEQFPGYMDGAIRSAEWVAEQLG